jgi:hypothetical protein
MSSSAFSASTMTAAQASPPAIPGMTNSESLSGESEKGGGV